MRSTLSCLPGRGRGTLIQRSDDLGRSWSEPVVVPLGDGGGPPDRPVVVVDRSDGHQRGSLYVAHGQSFPGAGVRQPLYGTAIVASRDGARSFELPVRILHDNLQQQPFDAAMLDDGALVVLFMDYAAGGRLLEHRRSWLVRSSDGGQSYSTPLLVHEQVDSEMPWSVAVDHSDRHRDRLYLAIDGYWKRTPPSRSNMPSTGMGGILVKSSDDGGESWSRAVLATDTPPRINQETPAIAVNASGQVGLAWYDTRADDRGDCFDLYFTASLDGGRSFLPNVRISEHTSCPRAPDTAWRGIGQRWAFGGDYTGLAAAADGSFHIFWAGLREGVYQIWTSRVTVTAEDAE